MGCSVNIYDLLIYWRSLFIYFITLKTIYLTVCFPEKAPTANPATDGVSRVFVSGEESGGTSSVLSFKNEEADKHDPIVRVLSFKNIENVDSPRTNNGTSVKVCDNEVVRKTHSRRSSDDSSDVVVQRRSRRESPRKHLTVNSRVKPMDVSPHKSHASSWMPASPAEEPSEMATYVYFLFLENEWNLLTIRA